MWSVLLAEEHYVEAGRSNAAIGSLFSGPHRRKGKFPQGPSTGLPHILAHTDLEGAQQCISTEIPMRKQPQVCVSIAASPICGVAGVSPPPPACCC